MKLENSFEVAAPPAEAWAVLVDVERVAPCVPGASLTEIVRQLERRRVASAPRGESFAAGQVNEPKRARAAAHLRPARSNTMSDGNAW